MGCCHRCFPRARQICRACNWKMKAACGNYSNQTQNSRNGSAHARVWPARRTQRAVTFRCARAEHQVCSNPGALLAAQQAGLHFRFNWPLKDVLLTTSTQHGENFHQCMHKSTLHGEHVTISLRWDYNTQKLGSRGVKQSRGPGCAGKMPLCMLNTCHVQCRCQRRTCPSLDGSKSLIDSCYSRAASIPLLQSSPRSAVI